LRKDPESPLEVGLGWCPLTDLNGAGILVELAPASTFRRSTRHQPAENCENQRSPSARHPSHSIQFAILPAQIRSSLIAESNRSGRPFHKLFDFYHPDRSVPPSSQFSLPFHCSTAPVPTSHKNQSDFCSHIHSALLTLWASQLLKVLRLKVRPRCPLPLLPSMAQPTALLQTQTIRMRTSNASKLPQDPLVLSNMLSSTTRQDVSSSMYKDGTELTWPVSNMIQWHATTSCAGYARFRLHLQAYHSFRSWHHLHFRWSIRQQDVLGYQRNSSARLPGRQQGHCQAPRCRHRCQLCFFAISLHLYHGVDGASSN
jgi:hypothetical protein